jgi:catalase
MAKQNGNGAPRDTRDEIAVDPTRDKITNSAGNAVADNQNSLTAGPRGPLVHDAYLMERMAAFNRERVPERVVHAKGSGAFGKLTVTKSLAQYTANPFWSKEGSTAETLLRFSTVAGEQGFADTARDPRGFALKVYTEDGNWDLVGNNTPVFFIRDGLKFSDFIHSQKRDPETGLHSPTMVWDFWSLSPESLHQVTWLMGDRGLPKSWRHMDGFGSHTFSLWNEAGERTYVKWHFKTQQGIESLTSEEGEQLAGENPDFHRADLRDAIDAGDFPKWTVKVQLMPEAEAATYKHNPFDLTKVWNYEDYPLIEVGELELNRNPTNFFAEIEQAAFEPGNFPVGLGASPDKMLQARLLSYPDAHRYRIGINYPSIEVNKPKCPVHTYHRDGQTRFDGNYGSQVNYEPNTQGGPAENRALREPPLAVDGPVDRYDHRTDPGNDDYKQAGDLFRLMDDAAKDRLVGNISGGLSQTSDEIQQRQLKHFYAADEDYGRRVEAALAEAREAPEGAEAPKPVGA